MPCIRWDGIKVKCKAITFVYIPTVTTKIIKDEHDINALQRINDCVECSFNKQCEIYKSFAKCICKYKKVKK
jgi:hypothetical protein